MDELMSNLDSFSVTGQANSIHNEHPRYSQFKAKPSKFSQEERRKAVLEARKLARYDLFQHLRNVDFAEPDAQVDKAEVMDECFDEVAECYGKPKRFRNFLMLSEWLVEVPDNFSEQYYVMPCPVGKRVLVVSGHGSTVMYDRAGKFIERFYSVFPGGGPLSGNKDFAMFDCIVSYTTNTFYVLDMMAWTNQPILQCPTSFRFEWLKSRFDEYPYDLGAATENHTYRFELLPFKLATREGIVAMLQDPGFSLPCDGLLFYHLETYYTHGQTPLVGWLKPYMLNEILGIEVPVKYLQTKPSKYTNLQEHIRYCKEMRAASSDQRQRKKNTRTKCGMELEATARLSSENKESEEAPNDLAMDLQN